MIAFRKSPTSGATSRGGEHRWDEKDQASSCNKAEEEGIDIASDPLNHWLRPCQHRQLLQQVDRQRRHLHVEQ